VWGYYSFLDIIQIYSNIRNIFFVIINNIGLFSNFVWLKFKFLIYAIYA